MTMRAPCRVWRTDKGVLVPEDDPRAATLAYAVGDEINDADVPRWLRPETKRDPDPVADKARHQPHVDKRR